MIKKILHYRGLFCGAKGSLSHRRIGWQFRYNRFAQDSHVARAVMIVSVPRQRLLRVALVFSLVALALPMRAQNPRGTVRGVVEDSTGARVPLAKIVVRAGES